jgi:hypothetical protein
MKRRAFITLVGGAAAAWPFAAGAQQPMPVIGFLRSAPIADVPHLVKAFRDGLKEAGFIEGQNVAIEYRSGDDDRNRLIEQVRDLIQRPVAVIVGNVVAAAAAKTATTTIPIVFATGSDPVADGLITNLKPARPSVFRDALFEAVAVWVKRLIRCGLSKYAAEIDEMLLGRLPLSAVGAGPLIDKFLRQHGERVSVTLPCSVR